MKTIIKNFLLLGGVAAAMASCSEDSWNNRLDGFEGGADNSQVMTVSYTLTDADYKRFAENRFNEALAEEQGVQGALAAVASQHYLTPATPADEYMPNLLKDSLFAYFGLNDGSAINLTYREVSQALPAVMQGICGASEYAVGERAYQEVYGSDENYAPAFAPSWPASVFIPRLLRDDLDEAKAGDYVLVKYSESDVDPDFNESFEMTSVISDNLAVGSSVEISGVVTAVCTRGIIVTDNSGSILVYSSSFPAGSYEVGQQVKVNATIASFKNCLQVAYDSSSIVVMGDEVYTYPAPVELTPDYLLKAGENADPVTAVYGHMTGTVVIDGTYINIAFDGVTDVRGSAYYVTDEVKAKLEDGKKYSLLGYFTQTSKSGDVTNCNFVITDVEAADKAARRNAPRRVVAVPSVDKFGLFTFDGSAWSAVGGDVVVLQPADYTAMGEGSFLNLSNDQPAQFLPRFLKAKYPYAVADDVKYVAYRYYGADKSTVVACTQYTFDGSEWVDTITRDGVETVTNQFVLRNGKWVLDPSVELTLPSGKNQPLSTWFFQACVDWVRDNVPDGSAYITSYGNNDYYTGASAYQGNIDLRPDKAVGQNPKAYEGMNDEEIVALEKKRFEDEVCPGVLAVLYPDMAPIGEVQPTITIHFFTYDGSTKEAVIVYRCVEKGKFELDKVNWDIEAEE